MDINISRYDAVSSTNTLAKQLLSEQKASEGLVLLANYQTEGRGQQGTIWTSEPGKNLLFSLVLEPTFLSVQQQVYLNMAICLALHDVISKQVDGVKIKWPNDIYVDSKKIAGILIENALSGSQLKNTVVGIGLNVNQSEFDAQQKAVSLYQLTGNEIEKSVLLDVILKAISIRYVQLQLKQFEKIKDDYHHALLGWKQKRMFKAAQKEFEALIYGVDEDGRLVLQHEDRLEKFMVKQISMI
jgi:BirA family biotin operon repressor/biotin-[acetyl-CoA-carboxylase] ligase